MNIVRSWRVAAGFAVLITTVILACSDKSSGKGGASASSSSGSGPVGPELARTEIGENGGTLTGAGITIEIPQGALTKNTTVTIGGLDPNQIGLPTSTKIAGGAYILGPDDVDFLKPVTVRVTLDANLDPSTKGAAVLFRATPYTNDWKAVGSSKIVGAEVVGQTTHFSWWAPAAGGETGCFNAGCIPDGSATQVPPEQQGLACKIPIEGPGVVCQGVTPPHFTAPFECHCEGSTEVIARFETRPPAPVDLKAYAQQCGGVCPPRIEVTCDLQMTCTPPTGGDDWTCTGKRAPEFTCVHKKGEPGSSCTCLNNGKVFVIPNTTTPPQDIEVGQGYFHTCGGTCEVATGPGTSSGTSGGPGTSNGGPPPDICDMKNVQPTIDPGDAGDPSTSSCRSTSPVCTDGKTYSVACHSPTGAPTTWTCECFVNGAKTKDVTANCLWGGNDPTNGWSKCGFPLHAQ